VVFGESRANSISDLLAKQLLRIEEDLQTVPIEDKGDATAILRLVAKDFLDSWSPGAVELARRATEFLSVVPDHCDREAA
jgi:hypothetical protein